MKILHTSDWHLGRTLHKVDLHEHQAAFLDWLVDLVVAESIDVVVIPGDVYDRAVPAVSSVKLLDSALARLAGTGATVVLPSGNHDSPERLGFGRGLMKAGIHLLTDVPGIEHPVSVEDEHGEVLFFGLPYLEPDRARTELVAEGEPPLALSHEAVTRAALDRVREHAAAPPGARTVVLAHTFVTGGDARDSERDLSVGGVDSVPAGVLGGIDYLALGHLHGCQDLTRTVGAPAWYSGSPLAFSFSEKNHRKSVLLVELGATGEDGRAAVSVQRIETPVPRPLTELRGPLEEILAQRERHGGDWLKAVVTDPARPAHLQEQLREAFPHLLLTEYAPEGRQAREGTPVVRREQNPLEVMDEFLAHVTGAAPTPAEHDVLDRAYAAVRRQREAS